VTDQGRLQNDHPLGLCLVAAGRGDTIPLKETLDLPDPTWLQFRRRFDKLAPFCRIASHTSEEVRDILATLETVYQPLFPQLNLRQWAGTIYTWLTHPVLDPTHSGRVTMDNLMKLVTTALEWSYLAGETDVRAERLKSAAELLVLRHDTLKIIDGAGPYARSQDQDKAEPASANGKGHELQTVSENEQQDRTKTVETAKEQEQRQELILPLRVIACIRLHHETFDSLHTFELEHNFGKGRTRRDGNKACKMCPNPHGEETLRLSKPCSLGRKPVTVERRPIRSRFRRDRGT